jgi:hypothetical protein
VIDRSNARLKKTHDSGEIHMRIHPAATFCLTLLLTVTTAAQETSLNRSEVTAIRAKLVTVQGAMGADPAGYIKESEDFNLPTNFNPASGGKFWPITSSISLSYTDRATVEGTANLEQAAAEFEAKYAAALATGNPTVITQMVEEMTRMQTQAMAAAMSPAAKKVPMNVYVQFNMNPSVSIDPEAIVLERPGVIVLRDKELTSDEGNVNVYIDPVVLAATEELSQFELRTAQDGVGNKTGIYHIVISANGSVPDIEAWVQSFDFDAMMGVFDPR